MLVNGIVLVRVVFEQLELLSQSLLRTFGETGLLIGIFHEFCDYFVALSSVELFVEVFWEESWCNQGVSQLSGEHLP